MDTPSLIFYEHSLDDSQVQSLTKSVLNLGNECRAWAEENARLKAEVERLKEGNECLDKMHEKEMARSAYLCEEVNRTTAWGRGLESDLSHARVEISFLKAEVERLTRKIEVADNHAQCLEMVINAGTANELRLKAEVERLNNLIISGGAVNPDASVYTE